MTIDPRLQKAFGGPALSRLREMLRVRVARGRDLFAPVTLQNPSHEERRAIESVLGRPPGKGSRLTVRPADVEQALQKAGLANDLCQALQALDGPIEDLVAARRAQDEAWRAARAPLDQLETEFEQARATWQQLERDGALKRASAGSPARAGVLAAHYVHVVREVGHGPAGSGQSVSLAALAARVTGDAHGFDPGKPLTTLVARYLADAAGTPRPSGTEERRALWRAFNVEPDPLSSHVLVLNLPTHGPGPVATTLAAHAAQGEPCRLTLRELERFPLVRVTTRDVFVCENPSVLAAAAERLGPDSHPLVCVEGQPSAAAHRLLGTVASLGIRLHYHGDFDWDGLRIANGMVQRHRALPWRLTREAYLNAPAGPSLDEERRVEAVWDAELSRSMLQRGAAVHEEAVLETLLEDLRACRIAPPSSGPTRCTTS